MKVLLDTNIFFNVWRKEVDDSGKELWKTSKAVIDEIESGNLEGYLSIVSVMEVAVVIRKSGAEIGKKENEIEKELKILC